MSNGENRSSRPHFRAAPLITSAAMVGGGTMIALAGLAVGGGHLLSTTRQWLDEMEVGPTGDPPRIATPIAATFPKSHPRRMARTAGPVAGLGLSKPA